MVENKTLNKSILLASAGIGLQMVGSICMLVASAGMVKEANRKLKQVIVRELSKQLEETK